MLSFVLEMGGLKKLNKKQLHIIRQLAPYYLKFVTKYQPTDRFVEE